MVDTSSDGVIVCSFSSGESQNYSPYCLGTHIILRRYGFGFLQAGNLLVTFPFARRCEADDKLFGGQISVSHLDQISRRGYGYLLADSSVQYFDLAATHLCVVRHSS